MAPSGNNSKENDEIIILASEYLLSLIEKADLGFMDGTFKVVPCGFVQIFILIILNPETNLFTPVCFIFLNSKTEDGYYLAFSGLKVVLDKLKITMNI